MVSSLLISKTKDTLSDDIMKNLNVISFSTCIMNYKVILEKNSGRLRLVFFN